MKNHLSIFLAKEGLSDSDIIDNISTYGETGSFLKTEFENKRIYYQKSYPKEPKWVKDFFRGFDQIDKTAFWQYASSLIASKIYLRASSVSSNSFCWSVCD